MQRSRKQTTTNKSTDKSENHSFIIYTLQAQTLNVSCVIIHVMYVMYNVMNKIKKNVLHVVVYH